MIEFHRLATDQPKTQIARFWHLGNLVEILFFSTFFHFHPRNERETGVVRTAGQILAPGKNQPLEPLSAQKVHFRIKQVDARNENKPNRERFGKELRRLEAQEDIVRMVFRKLPENEQTLSEMRENSVTLTNSKGQTTEWIYV